MREVPPPLVAVLGERKGRFGRCGRPAFSRTNDRAPEPVLNGADRGLSELAAIVFPFEGNLLRLPSFCPLVTADHRRQISSALTVPDILDNARRRRAFLAHEERAQPTNAKDQNDPAVATGVLGVGVGRGRQKAKQDRVSFAPHHPSDGLFGSDGRRDRRIEFQIKGLALVSGERGGGGALPANPVERCEQSGGCCMWAVMNQMSHSVVAQCRMGASGAWNRAIAVDDQKHERRVPATRRGRSSFGSFDSGVAKARVGQLHDFTAIHDSRQPPPAWP